MNLSSKIFLAFLILFASLTGLTLYITNQQTEEFEVTRLSDELEEAQVRFHEKIRSQQRFTLKLVKTITLDQKFRSFLAQIKDNFYSFTEEIALDTEADIVFMVDEDTKIRGIYPSTDLSNQWIQKNLNSFNLEAILDKGEEGFDIYSVGNELISAIFVPLKESLSDNYALGALVVGIKINDDWLQWLMGESSASSKLHVIFYSGTNRVAGNAQPQLSRAIMNNLRVIPEGQGTFLFSGERFITRRGSFGSKMKDAGFIYLSNLDQSLRPFKSLQGNILLASFGIFLVGMGFSFVFSKRIARPLRLLLSGTRKVVKGDYSFQIRHKSRDEVGKLSEAFNFMVQELKDKALLRDTFGKYVHPSIVENILANPDQLKLGGERRLQTIMFCDIADFTSLSEKLPPETLIGFLNQFLGAMAEELMALQGVLDKYTGDGFMAFWGPPFATGDHSLLGCLAAVNMQKRNRLMREKWNAEGLPPITARIGLATGNMIVGNIGSELAQDYTCIGDTVNYCSRLEGINKVYGTEIIIDYFTHNNVKTKILARELDTIRVKGREQGSRIYELIGMREDSTHESAKLKTDYENALEDYRSGDFELAKANFNNILNEFPDIPSRVMYERCCFYIKNPPKDWTGLHIMTTK